MKHHSESSSPQIGAEIVKRLALAYGVRDSAGALATAMGRPEGTVKNWAGRGSVPLEYLVQARADTGRTLDWLVLGLEPQSEKGMTAYAAVGNVHLHVTEPAARGWLRHDGAQPAMSGPDIPAPTGGAVHQRAEGRPSHALMPVTGANESRPLVLSMTIGEAGAVDYEVIPKMCGGANGPADNERDALLLDRAGEVAMTYEWLRRNLGHTTGQLASVQVIGDSMQPTLLDGDTIIIDRGVSAFGPDAIYAVHMLGQRLVKRVQRKLDGSVVIISDNAAYERETVPRGRVREIEVLGRMVWPRVR